MSKLIAVRNVVTSKAGRQVLKLQKQSPHILFAAGVVGVVGTAVLASRATLQFTEVLGEHEANAGAAHDTLELARLGKNNYSEEKYEKDMRVLKARLVKDTVKVYAPPVLVGVISIACLTGAHVTLNRRLAGVTAAYAILDKSFEEYRSRVTERWGEQAEKEVRFGYEEKEIAVDDPETGQTTVKTTRIAKGASRYAKFFGPQTSSQWSDDPGYNLITLRSHQRYANDKLHLKGHITLNEVYDALGLERTKEGFVVGWVKDSKNGDNYVDFGIFTRDNQDRFADFMTGREEGILLDFNVDGIIYDKI